MRVERERRRRIEILPSQMVVHWVLDFDRKFLPWGISVEAKMTQMAWFFEEEVPGLDLELEEVLVQMKGVHWVV